MNHVSLACAVTLAGVFLAAVWNKRSRLRFEVFVATAGPLSLLPRRWRGRAAAAVTAAESAVVTACAVGAVLAVLGQGGTVLLLGLLGAGALLLIFTVAIGLMLRRGERAPCHCFGTRDTPLGLAHVVRNLFLLALCVLGSLGDSSGFAVPGVVLAVVAGLLAATLVIRLDDLLALFSTTSPRRPTGNLR
ncbi:hypothetical protein JOF56_007967 [Kibdelosporangium banguiense]|uniref:Methylamine utilisation protein MauE domain-containing protein n=1 Tax=Kibdelosporangium banguiense TaxID=1365924 RepID=A0ABS4TT65_9PSEU|nr:MauE/DoxX family redox-associated membrane protein [Kibdelosporangium banguiense]MBP2327582.1 hypothetical protein [Kibdelosporangium banguiense]